MYHQDGFDAPDKNPNGIDYSRYRECEDNPVAFFESVKDELKLYNRNTCDKKIETVFAIADQVIRNLKKDKEVYLRQRDKAFADTERADLLLGEARSQTHHQWGEFHALTIKLNAMRAANDKLVELIGLQEIQLRTLNKDEVVP